MKVSLSSLTARHPAARSDAPDALTNVSVEIGSGEQVAVIGASGAGKTTLLHAIACALKPRQGHVQLDGIDPWSLSGSALQQLRGRLFLAPQTPPLPPRQRVVTAVLAGRLPAMSLAGSVASLFYPADIPAAHEALTAFDLADKLFHRVDRLSGGERQRVGLARALVSPAKLWLVDEPLSALDPARAELAITTLTREARARGATLITTLHQVEVALNRYERVLGFADGVLQFDLPAREVMHPQLEALYRQHPEELEGAAPEAPALHAPAAFPAAMHCR